MLDLIYFVLSVIIALYKKTIVYALGMMALKDVVSIVKIGSMSSLYKQRLIVAARSYKVIIFMTDLKTKAFREKD